MPLRGVQAFRFVPQGVADTLDGTNAPAGRCTMLKDLIPDPATKGVYQCRPAAVPKTSFAGFTTPSTVTVLVANGTKVYGMVASQHFTNHDEPFCFDTATGNFVAITGATLANTPATQSTLGAWTPATMALIGAKIIVTHPGFPGTGGIFIGEIDVTNPAAPTWAAGNTTTNALPSVPQAVGQFYGRAWYACGNVVYFSDVLAPTTITNASQSLTIGDNTPITALAPLPMATSTQGQLQALLAFKANIIFQITGDTTAGTLALNTMNAAVGCSAPRTIAPTPGGVMFMAVDGIRACMADGSVTDPLSDLRVPFISATVPSRASACYNAGVYRICVQNSAAAGDPYQEYWWDSVLKTWTGPHSFRQDCAVAVGDTFILANNGLAAALWQSDVTVSLNSVFTENGATMGWQLQTETMPAASAPFASSTIETTVNLQMYGSSNPVAVNGLDEGGNTLQSAQLAPLAAATIWGAFVWGAGTWLGGADGLKPRQVPWPAPLVFSRLAIQVAGASTSAIKISNINVLYRPLGYIP